jgi:hypothetical protein
MATSPKKKNDCMLLSSLHKANEFSCFSVVETLMKRVQLEPLQRHQLSNYLSTIQDLAKKDPFQLGSDVLAFLVKKQVDVGKGRHASIVIEEDLTYFRVYKFSYSINPICMSVHVHTMACP